MMKLSRWSCIRFVKPTPQSIQEQVRKGRNWWKEHTLTTYTRTVCASVTMEGSSLETHEEPYRLAMWHSRMEKSMFKITSRFSIRNWRVIRSTPLQCIPKQWISCSYSRETTVLDSLNTSQIEAQESRRDFSARSAKNSWSDALSRLMVNTLFQAQRMVNPTSGTRH